MKTYFAAAAAALVVVAPAEAASFDGPFVGVQLNRDSYEVKADNTLVVEDDIDGDILASFDGLSANGTAIGLYAGYDIQLASGFFVGAEVNVSISDASASVAVTDLVSAKVEAQESYGVSARLGAEVLEGTGLYGRLGWQNTEFNAVGSDGFDAISVSQSQDAFVYGAGLETTLGSNIALRAEYLIEDYGSAGLNKELGANGLHVDNYKASLGLSYRF